MTNAGRSALVDLIESLPDNAGTWGPSITTETTLNGVPYAPYSKGDKLGRMADWTADSKDGRDGRGGRQQYNRNYRGMLALALCFFSSVLTIVSCRPTGIWRRHYYLVRRSRR